MGVIATVPSADIALCGVLLHGAVKLKECGESAVFVFLGAVILFAETGAIVHFVQLCKVSCAKPQGSQPALPPRQSLAQWRCSDAPN